MKTRIASSNTRLVSSIALAAALALSASGCAMFAPQGTTDPYAPSDGIEVTIDNVDVRNLMLIGDAAGENFNVVFTAVNNTDGDQTLHFSFVDPNSSATAEATFTVKPGLQQFGDLTATAEDGAASTDASDGDAAAPALPENVQIVSIPGLKIGSTVKAYVQIGTGQETEKQVPVLDGTLTEYQRFVPTGATAQLGETAS
ncbi:MAG: DNA modification methylase [Actinobacteria bacterium]|nr:DNA modification methylase [Actinomycetota bacterium]